MKKLASLALAAIIALSANAKKVEPSVRHSQTSEFTSVKVNAPVHLVIVPGRIYSVNVMSRNPELATAISWKVKDGVLSLNALDLESLEHSRATVDVIVTAPTNVNYQVGKDLKRVPNPRRPLRR